VEDTTAPEITAPADVKAEQTSKAGTPVAIGQATATDICDADVEITNNAPAPAVFPLGDTTVTWTATDDSGNATTATQTVTVVDTTAPELTVPADVTAEQTDLAGTPVDLGQATATDICDADVTVTNDAPAVFPLGETVVTWTATDDSGNKAASAQKVIIKDTTPPTLKAPADVTAEQTSKDGTPVALGDPTVSDICDADVAIANNAPAVFPLGTTMVTWTATDDAGNATTAQQKVTIVDTTKPQVALSTTVTSLWPANHDLVNVGLTLSVSDLCDANPVLALSVTQDEPVEDQGGDGNFSPDAKILRDAQEKITGLRLRAERQGSGDGRVYLIIATVTDASGNVTTKCCAVTVPKSQSQKDKAAVAAQAAAAVAAGKPLAYDSTAGPVAGPKQ
jgi:hypothetical protein